MQDLIDYDKKMILYSPLRQYQWEGVSFLLESESALLADEMGLGKTVEAVVALRLLLKKINVNKTLIITPRSLRLNWEREVNKWAPELVVRKLEGSSQDRAALYQLPIQILIASYEQIRNDAVYLGINENYDLIILDEAQRIKNPNSSTAVACNLVQRSRAWALTGTPVENSARDLISIYKFIKPGLLQDGMSRSALHRSIKPYFLRRTKANVLNDMPPILIQDLPFELEGNQKAAYEELWDDRESILYGANKKNIRAHMLAIITRLKQLCNYEPFSEESVKLDALNLILDSMKNENDKIIIFSQYVETLKWISSKIDHFPHNIFHGGLNEVERDKILLEFENGKGPCGLLISLKAGGVGLNLSSTSVVVLFDRWWNPAVEDQAIQRAHRFGRKTILHVYRFLVQGTIEERINEILKEKKELFEKYIDKADNIDLSKNNIKELMRVLELRTDFVT